MQLLPYVYGIPSSAFQLKDVRVFRGIDLEDEG